ncbi:MAG: dethiobiotin synthase [Mariprofundaceae bacterium]
MVRRIFVTATDTGAGKTFVTTALLCALREAGKDVIGLKPVASGSEGAAVNADVSALLRAQGMPESKASAINIYSFDAALAPSQAAALEGEAIDPKTLLAWCQKKSAGHAISLIEGVGGLMVPLVEDYLVSDWLSDMPDCEVILIVRARLGGINHALLTLDKLNHMGLPPRRVIINDADHVGQAMLERHQEALIASCAGLTELILMPYLEESQRLASGTQQIISSLI